MGPSTPVRDAASSKLPRTSTGLVPTSHRREGDLMFSPEKWSPLPPRPPPEMYPYRGDYVNKRNEKLRTSKKRGDNAAQGPLLCEAMRPKKAPAQKLSASGSEETKRPRTSRSMTVAKMPVPRREWDPYQLHSSRHRLSPEVDERKNKSKTSSLSYLRSAAVRRKAMSELQQKLEEEVSREMRDDEDMSAPSQQEPLLPKNEKVTRPRDLKSERSKQRSQGHREDMSSPKGENQTRKKSAQQQAIAYTDFISKKTQLSVGMECSAADIAAVHPNEPQSIVVDGPLVTYYGIPSRADKNVAIDEQTDDALSLSKEYAAAQTSKDESPTIDIEKMKDQVSKLEEKLSKLGDGILSEGAHQRQEDEDSMHSDIESEGKGVDLGTEKGQPADCTTAVRDGEGSDGISGEHPLCGMRPQADYAAESLLEDLSTTLSGAASQWQEEEGLASICFEAMPRPTIHSAITTSEGCLANEVNRSVCSEAMPRPTIHSAVTTPKPAHPYELPLHASSFDAMMRSTDMTLLQSLDSNQYPDLPSEIDEAIGSLLE